MIWTPHTPWCYKSTEKFLTGINNSVIGLDIAKNIFHVFTVLADGKTLKKKLKRHELLAFFANYPANTIQPVS